MTLRGIAKAAGVSHGAPLRHFASRAELLSAVATAGFAELLVRGEDLSETAPRERLTVACRGYIDFALTNSAMFELMFRHDLIDARDPGLSSKSSAVFDLFAQLVDKAHGQERHPGSDSRLVATSLRASLHGLAELWLWGGLARVSFASDIDLPLAVTLNAYLGSIADSSQHHSSSQ